MKISQLDFREIEPIWRNNLWPNRRSAIEPVSWINHLGEIDKNLEFCTPLFLGCRNEANELIGVISGMQTNSDYFRSRGIWVSQDCRKKGVGTRLISELVFAARTSGTRFLWTMPNMSSWGFYQRLGLEKIGETDKYENGPHYLAAKSVEALAKFITRK